MKKDVTRILIESMLCKAYRDGKVSPGRTARNMIDLGLTLSSGTTQKNFLSVAQKMLQKEDSAYYELARDLFSHVDKNILLNFGINVGYNGCVKGVKEIRKLEKTKGIHVPWAVCLEIEEGQLEVNSSFYIKRIEEGIRNGTYIYLISFCGGNPESLLPFFKKGRDCAFVIFLNHVKLNQKFLEEIRQCGNVLLSVSDSKEKQEQCFILRRSRLMYGIHYRYNDENIEESFKDQWLQECLSLKPHFIFFKAEEGCQKESCDMMYEHVLSLRNEQKHAVFCIDIDRDLGVIRNAVSEI